MGKLPTPPVEPSAESYTNELIKLYEKRNPFSKHWFKHKEGCIRLAEEYGYGLSQYSREQAEAMLHKSYEILCVKIFGRSLFTKAEWTDSVLHGVTRR